MGSKENIVVVTPHGPWVKYLDAWEGFDRIAGPRGGGCRSHQLEAGLQLGPWVGLMRAVSHDGLNTGVPTNPLGTRIAEILSDHEFDRPLRGDVGFTIPCDLGLRRRYTLFPDNHHQIKQAHKRACKELGVTW